MPHYLIVAHQTANSPELARHVYRIMRTDPEARFALVVPATPVNHKLTWDEDETRAIAARTAEMAAESWQRAGATVSRWDVGAQSPILAIEDAIRAHGETYDHLVVCTLPLGVSRWMKQDVVHQAERRTGLPVTHVVAHARVPVTA